MGYHFIGWQGDFDWSLSGWHEVLHLAMHFGWKPTGTGPPPRVRSDRWDGIYFTNSGQYVYKLDARALADALERAVDRIPLTISRRVGRKQVRDVWTEGDVAALRSFIRFCRKRGFRIW
jgi:hypothetical protein